MMPLESGYSATVAARDALDIAIEQRLSIIPLQHDKRPLEPWKQYQERAADAEQIARWRSLNPPLWAVITGAVSRLVILDFDGLNGALLLRMNRFCPHVRTPSGGFHLWLQHPGWPVKTLNCKADKLRLGGIFPGLGCPGAGGYGAVFGR